MEAKELEQHITVLQDIERIKKLKALYCEICDDNHNPDRIVKIFAEDGIWEATGMGPYKGHAAIRKAFEGFAERIAFSQHNVMNPQIEVNGDRAKGSWYFLGPFILRMGNRQIWIAARYEDDYVKINGEWKFQHLRAFGRGTAQVEGLTPAAGGNVAEMLR